MRSVEPAVFELVTVKVMVWAERILNELPSAGLWLIPKARAASAEVCHKPRITTERMIEISFIFIEAPSFPIVAQFF